MSNDNIHFNKKEALRYFRAQSDDKSAETTAAVKKRIQEIVDRINKNLQPYQRITNIEVLDEPIEMTTTLKVKRKYKK